MVGHNGSPLKSIKQLCSLVSSIVVTFKAFNFLNWIVFFYNKLKSNGLKNLMDQRLPEATFGVTINV